MVIYRNRVAKCPAYLGENANLAHYYRYIAGINSIGLNL